MANEDVDSAIIWEDEVTAPEARWENVTLNGVPVAIAASSAFGFYLAHSAHPVSSFEARAFVALAGWLLYYEPTSFHQEAAGYGDLRDKGPPNGR